MPYTAGTQGAQTNCGLVFMTMLDPLLIAAQYEFVEQVLNGAETVRIYKSPAAKNYFGQDWFLLIRRSSDTAGTIYFAVTEQYNSTTHLCFNYAPSATGLTPTAQFAVNDAAGKAPYNTALSWSGYVDCPATGFNYFLSLTADRVLMASRAGTSDSGGYAGLYDDFHLPVNSPFPLMVTTVMAHPSGQSSRGCATREPYTTGLNTYNFQSYMAYGLGALTNWTNMVFEGYSQKSWVSRVTVVNGGRGNYIRGLLRDVWFSPTTGVNGDTLASTLNGVSTTLVQASRGGGFFVDVAR